MPPCSIKSATDAFLGWRRGWASLDDGSSAGSAADDDDQPPTRTPSRIAHSQDFEITRRVLPPVMLGRGKTQRDWDESGHAAGGRWAFIVSFLPTFMDN